MKLALVSSVFVLTLALGAAPAVLAADSTTATPATTTPAPAAPAKAAPAANTPAASDAGSDSGDADSAPPAEAPVPDPFLAEVYKDCRDGASGDKGTFQRLQDAGWNLTVDGDTQTPFYQAFNGEKDFDGVGTVDITYSLEVYPTMTEGYCSLSIDTADRKIGIADFKKIRELRGEVRTTADGVSSNWQDNIAEPVTFIQADQHTKDLYFLLDVTTLMKKPAADIPFVQPAPESDSTTDNAD